MTGRFSRAVVIAASLTVPLLYSTVSGPRSHVRADVTYSSQRNPYLVIDRNGYFYLTGAVATLPASAHSPGSQIFFTRSTDGGATWDNQPVTRNLSNSQITGIGALEPRMAITPSGKVRCYVVYDDDTRGPRQAYFVRSKKNINFKSPIRLSQPGDGGFLPQVASDEAGNVDVVWADSHLSGQQIMFRRSTDFGVSFSDQMNISQSKKLAYAPAIAVDTENAIDVAWQDTASGPTTIMFSRSTDDGATWSTPVPISAGTGDATQPQLGIDTLGGINLVWVQQVDGAIQLMVARSTDGVTFSEPVQITTANGASVDQPALAFFDGTTYIAYQDDRSGQVYLTFSASDTLNFGPGAQFSNAVQSKGEAHSPSLAVDKTGRVFLVYIDSSILGNQEGLVIYTTTKDGVNFTKRGEVLTFIQF